MFLLYSASTWWINDKATHSWVTNGDDVLLIVRDLPDVQSPADYNEDFGYMLIKLDNDLTLFNGATLPVCDDASLLGGG